jgi:hypothetical protein
MVEEKKGMRPIWYFVGWVLFIIGGLVILGGIYDILFPRPGHTVLRELHPSLWWGLIIAVIGIVFVFKNKNRIIK